MEDLRLRRLKFRDLHILDTVAEAGSMAKAAPRLGMSQPAVSRVVADMEHLLGVPLFDRTSTGVELTRLAGRCAAAPLPLPTSSSRGWAS